MSDVPSWKEMLGASQGIHEKWLLALDPGETTGWAVFKHGILHAHGQLDTHTVTSSVNPLVPFISHASYVVVENYQVYAWKLKEHKWDTLHTPRLIGCIETLCVLNNVLLTKQTAQNAKKFVTDDKLKHWDMYVKGKPHARDAIRHAIFYTIFGGKST